MLILLMLDSLVGWMPARYFGCRRPTIPTGSVSINVRATVIAFASRTQAWGIRPGLYSHCTALHGQNVACPRSSRMLLHLAKYVNLPAAYPSHVPTGPALGVFTA